MNFLFRIFHLYQLFLIGSFFQSAFTQVAPQNIVLPVGKEAADSIQMLPRFKELHQDFGAILQGDSVTVTFSFSNHSQSAVSILFVLPDAGYIHANFPKGAIEPKQVGKIQITYISKANQKGKVNEKISVKFSTNPEYVVLTLTGMVMQKL